MDDTIRTTLYVRHQTAADLAGWSPSRDIAWNQTSPADRERDADILARIREACLTEAANLSRLVRLSQAVADDLDAVLAISIVTQETGKHFHALRLYLERVEARPQITDREIAAVRAEATASAEPDQVSATVSLLLNGHVAAQHYRGMAARADGPVLPDLLRLIAADKVRHGRMACDLLERWVEADRRIAPRVQASAERLERAQSATHAARSSWSVQAQVALRTLASRLARICGQERIPPAGPAGSQPWTHGPVLAGAASR